MKLIFLLTVLILSACGTPTPAQQEFIDLQMKCRTQMGDPACIQFHQDQHGGPG